MRSRLALATAVASAAVALAGCSGADDPSAGSTTAPTSESTPPSTAPTDEAPTATTDPASYLPVPTGVTLTEPGAQLALKDSAIAAWTPRQGLVGVIDVAVTRIEVTTVKASLANFELSDAEKRATPYFVRSRVTNVGATDLGARQLPLYLLDSEGILVAPTGIAPDFAPCPGSMLPAIFAPGDDAKSCLIFLVPEGSDLQSVMFRPPEGVVPLTWTGLAKPFRTEESRPGKARGERGRGRDRSDS